MVGITPWEGHSELYVGRKGAAHPLSLFLTVDKCDEFSQVSASVTSLS